MKRAKIIWSPDADNDLIHEGKRIALDKPRAAVSFIARLRKSVNRLRAFPESGWMLEDVPVSDYREIVFRGYRIIYHYDGKAVNILKVIHSSRRFRLNDLKRD